jgi:hypothetical protein
MLASERKDIMSRRQLDIVIATAGAMVALLVVTLGLVLRSEANFAERNVTEQLQAQKIMFKPEAQLTASEREVPGMETYADEQLVTGKQAQAYAGYIAVHLREQAERAGFAGETYASISTPMAALRTQIADAKAAGDTQTAADAQKKFDAATALRENQFKGETLRGMLLTSYGFSVVGERAALAATISFGIAAVAALLSLAGFVHAFVTPKEQTVFAGVVAPTPAPTST